MVSWLEQVEGEALDGSVMVCGLMDVMLAATLRSVSC
jgi:hypothetical protein